MLRVPAVSLFIVCVVAGLASAAPGRRDRADDRPGVHTTALAPDARNIADSDDARFPDTEEGCAGARVIDYLERHGDYGRIDSEVLLEVTRENYRARRELRQWRPAASSIGGTNWTSMGPTNGAGRMIAVAPDPSVSGTAFVGAAGGGVWKTTTGGTSWTPLTEDLANLSVGALAIAPSSPSTIYAGTGEGGYAVDFIPGIGLLKSTDGGNNWTLPSTVIATMFYRVLIHPTNANELVVGTRNGALRSTNGQNGPWTTVISGASSGVTKAFGDVTDVVRDPTNASILYATTWDRNAWCARFACTNPSNLFSPAVLKSTNGGATWAPSATNLPVSDFDTMVDRMAIAISPSTPSTLYVATATFVASTGLTTSHIYKSVDSGATWNETSLSATVDRNKYLSAQAWYDNTIVVSPSSANTVIAGGVFYVITTDGGTTWTAPAFTGTSVHVDAHELRYDSAGTLWIGNDGGIWTSTDNASSATDRNTGLVTRQFYAMAQDPSHPNRIIGGQQDNGTITLPDGGGTAWSFFSGGDGIGCAIDPNNPAIAYSTVQFGVVLRSKATNVASPLVSNCTPVFGITDNAPFLSRVLLDPTSPARVYTASHRLWRSDTGCDAWTPLPTTTTDASVWNGSIIRAMAVARSNPLILMVAKGGAVFRSTNGGTTWTAASAGLPGRNVNHLEIDPTDAARAYAAFAGASGTSVYFTLNGGTTWTPRGTGLPSFSALVVRVDPTDASTLYCGTDVGVYRSTDGGANWSDFSTAMPAVSVYDIQAAPDGSTLRAATHGRGIWQLTVAGVTNSAPTVIFGTPAIEPTVTRGSTVALSGTFSDINSDPLTATWHFSDDWSTAPASSGAPINHTFNRAGRFPVSLTVVDSNGASGSATQHVTVTPAGDGCAAPVVIPAAGPFPHTVTIDTEVAAVEGTDPSPVSVCYPFGPQRGAWASFTPALSGTYDFSLCGTIPSATVTGFTGNSCGPYTPIPGLCLTSLDTEHDCATAPKVSVLLAAGVPVRLMLTNYFFNDFGPVSLTVAQSSVLTPVLTSVAPAVGSTLGGTVVMLTGSGFASGATVRFDGVVSPSVTVADAATIIATTPVHAAGFVNVSVTQGGTTGTLAGEPYTYVAGALPPAVPPGFSAAATSATQVTSTWTTVAGATGYDVLRSSNGVDFDVAGAPAAPPFVDTVPTGTAFLYKVRASGPGGTSLPTSADLATTVMFTDDPLTPGVTIKAEHVNQLRSAVTAVALLAGIAAPSYTDPSLALGVAAVHGTDMRGAIAAARLQLGLSAQTFTHTLVTGVTTVRAVDYDELRSGVR